MDDENDASLDVVLRNCKNDFQLFLSTIAKYLGKKTGFSTCDLTNVSELFANAAKLSETHNTDKQNDSVTLETSTDTNDDAPGAASKMQIMDDDSRDMFETENINNNDDDDDDEIIPETQFLPEEESNDSGESVAIPLYVKPNGKGLFNSSTDASEEDSEFAQVRPESAPIDYTEPQSQMIMANLDKSILHDIEENANKEPEILASTQTVTLPSVSSDSQKNDEPNEDRGSASATPDFDYGTNGVEKEKEPLDKQQENDDDDLDQTQIFSQSIFDVGTQQQANQSSEDIFLASTQMPPVFKMPAAVSTPRAKAKQNPSFETQDNIFNAATQEAPQNDVFEAATQAAPQVDIYAEATQKAPQNDVYLAETQMFEEDDYIAETQMAPEDMVYDVATQALPSGKSSSTKKTVTWKNSDSQDTLPKATTEPSKSKPHNVSDDLFDNETEAFKAPKSANNVSNSNDASSGNDEDLNETDIFVMATQAANEPSTSKNIQRKQIPAVLTQCSQPANTPEWSLAARISKAEIDQFEKEQAEREAQKKREKLKKKRYLFAESEDDDENDDDFEFDLPKVNSMERMPSLKESQKRGKFDDNLKRPSSATSDESDSLPKRSKSNLDELVPRRIAERRVSVKVSRQEVHDYMRNEGKKKPNDSKKSSTSRETGKNTKAIETKTNQVKATEERNLRNRKISETVTTPTEGRNKRKASVNEQPQSREKRDKKEPRELAALMKNSSKSKTSTSSKSKEAESKSRNAKKDKSKENNNSTAVVTTNIPDSNLLSPIKRRTSDRSSTRNSSSTYSSSSSRPAILFTKVNSAPYIKVIQNLGGFIVDTPQLGTVLICDKISRTFKFLYALSKGIPIVSSQWLDASAKSGEFKPPDPYLVVDKNSEKRFSFSLRKSLESARRTPLFVNYHICTTPNVQPVSSEIAEIVECAGGIYVNSPLKKRKPNTIAVLITHKKDSKMWKAYRDAYPDIQIVSAEGFMQSVVQQQINFSKYILT